MDALDREIGRLLSERIELAAEIQKWKRGHKIPSPVDPAREKGIVSGIKSRHPELPSELVDRVYEAIFSVTRRA